MNGHQHNHPQPSTVMLTVINVTIANEPQAAHTVDAELLIPPAPQMLDGMQVKCRRIVDPEFVLKHFLKFIEM